MTVKVEEILKSGFNVKSHRGLILENQRDGVVFDSAGEIHKKKAKVKAKTFTAEDAEGRRGRGENQEWGYVYDLRKLRFLGRSEFTHLEPGKYHLQFRRTVIRPTSIWNHGRIGPQGET